jgi:hypothetical protein
MFKSILLLIIIYFISVLYNNYIYPILLTVISINLYNNIIISLLILIQIDNFMLYNDYTNVKLEKDIFLNRFKLLFRKPKLSKSFNEKINELILNY